MCSFKISILLFTTKAAKQVKWGITVIYGSMNVSEITLKNKKLYKRFSCRLSLIRFYPNLFLLPFVCNLFLFFTIETVGELHVRLTSVR